MDLISRQAAIDIIAKRHCDLCRHNDHRHNVWQCKECEYQEAMDDIEDVPTAEPMTGVYVDGFNDGYEAGKEDAEPKKGKWMKTVTAYPYCSECDWMPEEDEMTHGFYRYCPNCGARMEE